jgi:large subunit ribosomal protein L29
MKQEVVKELSTADIKDRLDEERKLIVRMRLNHAVSPLENPNQIKEKRKTIARMETELRRRILEENNNK